LSEKTVTEFKTVDRALGPQKSLSKDGHDIFGLHSRKMRVKRPTLINRLQLDKELIQSRRLGGNSSTFGLYHNPSFNVQAVASNGSSMILSIGIFFVIFSMSAEQPHLLGIGL
jgi:ABC-type multidrug transport system permease subunit